MINLNFGLRNPFSNRWQHVVAKSGGVGKYKGWELELIKDGSIIGVGIRWTIRQDHAGVMLDFSLFGYNLIMSYYDTRHWNEEAGRFYNYDDAGNAS